MIEIIGLAVGIIVPLLGGIVWLVRLEGRQNVSDAKLQSMEKRVDGLEERIFASLDRIEAKLENKLNRGEIEIAR